MNTTPTSAPGAPTASPRPADSATVRSGAMAPGLRRAGSRARSRRVRTAAIAAGLAVAGCAAGTSVGPSGEPPEPHYQAAREAIRSGDTDTAGVEVRLALQDNPRAADAHFLLACLLAKQGETDQAVVGFQHALEIDPTSADALYNLGTLLLRRGESLGAARLLENAATVRPDHVPTYLNLAKAYFLTGLPELAVATYEEALLRDPSNVVALGNLLLLADAAGDPAAAARHRARLAALGTLAAEGAAQRTAPPATPSPRPADDAAPATAPVPAPQPGMDPELESLRDLVRIMPHVTADRRGGRLVLTGWTTAPHEKESLTRILAGRPEVLDLTGDDTGDPNGMIEVDAVLFVVLGLDTESAGFNFLRLIDLSFNYFAAGSSVPGQGFTAPGIVGTQLGLQQESWVFSAAADYSVNIANATTNRVAVLARPHLTALSGTPATFLAGGELIFSVSGLNSGDIKPYPFGTTLTVTPTLLRTPAEGGAPRVHMSVEAGRTSVLTLLSAATSGGPTSFDKVKVTSQAVLTLGDTLILSGLNQRESRTEDSGVPGLKSIPILKWFFSSTTTVESNSAVVILLTPRDPAYWGSKSRKALTDFVAERQAFVAARNGTPEDMKRFRQEHPNWDRMPPNRFASHSFLMEASDLYRTIFLNESGQDLQGAGLDLDLLGK